PFVKQVSVSGRVTASQEVAMAFEESGRVERIYVEVGQKVTAGTPLASLSAGTLSAQLAAAQAQASLKRVQVENRSVNLEEVTKQQNTLVASAFRTLASTDLEAEPQFSAYTAAAPVISGVYRG